MWSIRRHSDLLLGTRERRLLNASIRWGLVKVGASLFALALVATALAAAFSVTEEWDAVRLAEGHTAAVHRLALSPDGRLLVSAGEDNRVIVWEFETRRRLVTLAGHTDMVYAVAFSHDGKWFATGSRNGEVIVWDSVSLQKVAVLAGHQREVYALAFSTEGRHLFSWAYQDRTIVWETGPWRRVRDLGIGGLDPGELFVFFASRGLREGPSSLSPQFGCATTAAVAPATGALLSVDSGGNVSFCDPAARLLHRERAHHDHGRGAAYSADGRLAATAAEDIVLWDATRRTKLARFQYPAVAWDVIFSQDGRWVVSGHGDGAILLWDVAERARVAGFNEHASPVGAVAFSPDGRHVASGSDDHSVILWDAVRRSKEAVLTGHPTRVTGVSFAPDGRGLASVDIDGNVILWDLERGLARLRFNHPRGGTPAAYSVVVSPDGNLVATSHGIYDGGSGRQVVRLEDFGLNPLGYGTHFSRDGRWYVATNVMGEMLWWDTREWRLVDRIGFPVDAGRRADLLGVALSPDARWCVAGDMAGGVWLFETRPLRLVGQIGRHAARVRSLSFSPDGREVATASDDGTIALWDVAGRRLIRQIGLHAAPSLSVAFSPDGRSLAVGGHDNAVRLYSRRRVLWGFPLD